MAFTLPELTYAYDALEPFMDAKTVEIHHDKHHATYTAKLNTALEKYPEFFKMSIVEILSDLTKVPEDVRGAVRNHGGGFYHHNLWWEQLGPKKGGTPVGKFAEALKSRFGSFDSFKKELSDASIGVFGSGWGWLCKDGNGELVITTTPNQDSPVSKGLHPILTIDVWEHAYYLKYQNRRPEFVENFWNMVDWEKVNARYS
jgi:Fe-Mn family superoxide dismutase